MELYKRINLHRSSNDHRRVKNNNNKRDKIYSKSGTQAGYPKFLAESSFCCLMGKPTSSELGLFLLYLFLCINPKKSK